MYLVEPNELLLCNLIVVEATSVEAHYGTLVIWHTVFEIIASYYILKRPVKQ